MKVSLRQTTIANEIIALSFTSACITITTWKRLTVRPTGRLSRNSPITGEGGQDSGLGWVSALDLEGRTIWIVDAHRDDGNVSLRTRRQGQI